MTLKNISVFDAHDFMKKLNTYVNKEFAEALAYIYKQANLYIENDFQGKYKANIEEQDLFKYIRSLDKKFEFTNYVEFIDDGFKCKFCIEEFFKDIQSILKSNGFINKKEKNRLASIELKELFLKEEKLKELKDFTRLFIDGKLNHSEANSFINILYCLCGKLAGSSPILAMELFSILFKGTPSGSSNSYGSEEVIRGIIATKMVENPYFSKIKLDSICDGYRPYSYPQYEKILNMSLSKIKSQDLFGELFKGNSPLYLFNKCNQYLNISSDNSSYTYREPMRNLSLNPTLIKINNCYGKFLNIDIICKSEYEKSFAFYAAKYDQVQHLKLVQDYNNELFLVEVLKTAVQYKSPNVLKTLLVKYSGFISIAEILNFAITESKGDPEMVQVIVKIIIKHLATLKDQEKKIWHHQIFMKKDKWGRTLLMNAIGYDSEKIVEIILEQMEFTPTQLKAYSDHIEWHASKKKRNKFRKLLNKVTLSSQSSHKDER
ncbi:hypothetical protein ACFLZV_03550 [Candidatus Margulisiibacteriota bacterium]